MEMKPFNMSIPKFTSTFPHKMLLFQYHSAKYSDI